MQEQYNNSNGDSNDAVTTTTTVEETVMTGEGAGLRRGSDSHVPSRSFKFLQDQQAAINRTSGINNREDLAELYNKRMIIEKISLNK